MSQSTKIVPTADYSRPIELIMECHRRVEHFWTVLMNIASLRGATLNDDQRESLRTGLDYFLSAIPRHTEDEEISMFSRMLQTGDPRVHAVMEEIKQLESEHDAVRSMHDRVDELGRRWLDCGSLGSEDADEWASLVSELQQAYNEHIKVEDGLVFPVAAEVLDRDALDLMGKEMAARRAANPGRAGSRCAERRLKEAAARGELDG